MTNRGAYQPVWTRGSFGWILAVIAMLVGILIVLDVLAVTPHVIGFTVILLAAAILL